MEKTLESDKIFNEMCNEMKIVKSIFSFDARSIGIHIENKYGDHIYAPEKGIYRSFSETPVVKEGTPLFTKEGDTFVPLDPDDFTVCEKDVYGLHGIRLLSSTVMREKEKFLSTKPTSGVMGSHVVACVIENIIYSNANYPEPDKRNFPAKEILTEEGNNLFTEGYMEEEIDTNLINDLYSFIEDKEWDLFDISLSNGIITIKQGIDWRVKDWYTHRFDTQLALERAEGLTI
jgi:hypothetical protein